VEWFANWIVKPIVFLTVFGMAGLLFLLWWPLGLLGLLFGLLIYPAMSASIDAEQAADSCRPPNIE
jgi:hypothetical protein